MNNTKPWYRSSTIWIGIIAILLSTYESLDATVFNDTLWNIPDFVYGILAVFGINGRRVADKKIQ